MWNNGLANMCDFCSRLTFQELLMHWIIIRDGNNSSQCLD